jgi:hypothetical protein
VPIYVTIWLITIGLTASYIAFGSRTMNGALIQVHKELEEAAEVSGATPERILRGIMLPLVLPAFVSGWIWVASHSLRSFSIPLMLGTRNSKVLSVIMWDLWDQGMAGPLPLWGSCSSLPSLSLRHRQVVDKPAQTAGVNRTSPDPDQRPILFPRSKPFDRNVIPVDGCGPFDIASSRSYASAGHEYIVCWPRGADHIGV